MSLLIEHEVVNLDSFGMRLQRMLSYPAIKQLAIKDEFGFVIHLESGCINLWFCENQPVIR